MEKLKVSVIIPCHNAGQYLENCLGHLVLSSYSPSEIIVVDDASKDNSREIAKLFNVLLIELPENRGVGFARNTGAKCASGDILLFVDADVLVAEDLLVKIVAGFSDPDVQVFQGVVSYEPANSSYGAYCSALEWHYKEKNVFANGNVSYHFNSQCCAVRREFFLELGGFNTSFSGAGGEEFEIDARIMEKTEMRIEPDITYKHHFQPLLARCLTLVKRAQNFYPIMKRKEVRTPLKSTSFSLTYAISLASPFLLFLSWVYFVVSIVLLFVINAGYFKFLVRLKGPLAPFLVFPGFYCHNLSLAVGLAIGVLRYHFLGYMKERKK